MALVNLKEVLWDAYQRKYAVGSFNVINMEFLEAIIEAAEQKLSPVILAIAEVHFKYVNIENITPAIREVARRARVPVVVHLDHGTTLEAIIRALRAGFTSVMFDGSLLSFEENVRRTKEIVNICHAVGVTVEAELGHVTGGEGGEGGTQAVKPEDLYTRVDEAEEFVRRTGVDALAVAIGTVHGIYKAEPRLDFDRLAKINEALRIPLVLHGGTGLSTKDFRQAISLGVAKINFYTGMSVAACNAIRNTLKQKPDTIDFPALMQECKKSIQQVVAENMEIFMSAGICQTSNTLCDFCTGCQLKPTSTSSVPEEELIRRVTEATVEVLKRYGY